MICRISHMCPLLDLCYSTVLYRYCATYQKHENVCFLTIRHPCIWRSGRVNGSTAVAGMHLNVTSMPLWPDSGLSRLQELMGGKATIRGGGSVPRLFCAGFDTLARVINSVPHRQANFRRLCRRRLPYHSVADSCRRI